MTWIDSYVTLLLSYYDIYNFGDGNFDLWQVSWIKYNINLGENINKNWVKILADLGKKFSKFNINIYIFKYGKCIFNWLGFILY